MLVSSARRASYFLLFGVSAKSTKTNSFASFASRSSECEPRREQRDRRAVSLCLNINDFISENNFFITKARLARRFIRRLCGGLSGGKNENTKKRGEIKDSVFPFYPTSLNLLWVPPAAPVVWFAASLRSQTAPTVFSLAKDKKFKNQKLTKHIWNSLQLWIKVDHCFDASGNASVQNAYWLQYPIEIVWHI